MAPVILVAVRVTDPPTEIVSLDAEMLTASGALTTRDVDAEAEQPLASVKV